MKQILRLAVAALLIFTAGVQAQVVIYPEGLATGMPHNDDYTVRVRVPGGEWKDLFEYNVQVDMDKVQDASMVQFDMGSPVEVMVKKNTGMRVFMRFDYLPVAYYEISKVYISV